MGRAAVLENESLEGTWLVRGTVITFVQAVHVKSDHLSVHRKRAVYGMGWMWNFRSGVYVRQTDVAE